MRLEMRLIEASARQSCPGMYICQHGAGSGEWIDPIPPSPAHSPPHLNDWLLIMPAYTPKKTTRLRGGQGDCMCVKFLQIGIVPSCWQ